MTVTYSTYVGKIKFIFLIFTLKFVLKFQGKFHRKMRGYKIGRNIRENPEGRAKIRFGINN